jgi:serine/threonine-protein kinase
VSDKSILLRLSEQGQPAGRVNLRGTERSADAKTRYEIVGEIARGGVGVVHRGRDNDLGRDVALKVLRDEFLANPELVRRFVEEAQIGAQLQHPGIVPVYELGLRDDQRPFFAMKLVKGETLAARLAARKDPGEHRRRLLTIFREACRTVAYAHARGVIHRDLKPANIMIGSFGEVQVVDWGFAKVLRAGGIDDERLAKTAERLSTMIATVRTDEAGSASVAGSVMGTPAYMPPEQALGHVDQLDARSDVFCLGGILCEILTGKAPFRGIHEASVCDLDDVERRLDTCGADERLVQLCKRALAPLPKDRPADAQAVADEVATYLAQAEGRAHRMQVRAAQSGVRAQQQVRARRFTRVLAGAVLAGVIAIAGTLLWIHDRQTALDRREAATIAAAVRAAQTEPSDEKALVVAYRARDLGGHVDALIAELEGRIAAKKRRAELETRARTLRERLEEAGSKHKDPEFTAAQIDAEYEAALAGAQVTILDIADELAGAPLRPEIASALELWAYMRSRDKDRAQMIHDVARRLDPTIAERGNRPVAPDAIEGIAPTRLAIMAWTLGARKQHAAAEALLLAARERHPASFWVNTALGNALVRRKDHLGAARCFEAACALRPKSIESFHKLGKALEAAGEHDNAIAAFRHGTELDPEWAHGMAHLAQVHLSMGNVGEAETAARRAALVDSNELMAYSVLGRALKERGDLAGAASALERVGSATRLQELVEYQLEAGQADAAVRTARKVVALRDDGWSNTLLANALIAAKQMEAARTAARRAMAFGIEGRDATARWDHLSAALHEVGELDAAERAHRRYVKLAKRSGDSLLKLSSFLRRTRRDFDEALALAEEARDRDKAVWESWMEIGWCLRALGRTRETADAWMLGARHLTDPRERARMLGSAATPLGELGQFEEAAALCREAHRLDPEDRRILGSLVNQLLRLQAWDEAVGAGRKLVKLEPSVANRNNLAGCLHRAGRAHEAVAVARETLRSAPGDASAWIMLGSSQRAAQQYDDSLASYRKAAALGAKGTVWTGIGIALAQRGDHEGAVHAYEEARKELNAAPLHRNWAHALIHLGRFDEAIRHARTAVTLAPNEQNKGAHDAAKRYADCARRLQAGEQPAGGEQCVWFANAQLYRKRYEDAVRLYLQAERIGTKEPLPYRRACRAAAKAGNKHRALAWRWLRAAWKRKAFEGLHDHLLHEPDLTSIRDAKDLTAEEQAFWAELRAALVADATPLR